MLNRLPKIIIQKSSFNSIRKKLSVKRRQLLKMTFPIAAVSLSSSLKADDALNKQKSVEQSRDDSNEQVTKQSREQAFLKKRYRTAYEKRVNNAKFNYEQSLKLPLPERNGDEARYADKNYYASFAKTLPNNEYGEVDPVVFEKLIESMYAQDGDKFSYIPIHARSQVRMLANPQGALLFLPEGGDSHAFRMPPPHTFRSKEVAAEMAELYWMSMIRDLPFDQFENNATIELALEDLNRFSNKPGQLINGRLTAETIFRGETPGDIVGPYISQFLLNPIDWGANQLHQLVQTPVPNLDFMTNVDFWRRTQLGESLVEENEFFDLEYRYITNFRMLGEYVHRDLSYQTYIQTAAFLFEYGRSAYNPGNPYRAKIFDQAPFVTFGRPYILDLVARVAKYALAASWYQKWGVHRYLRPEEYSARVHFKMTEGRDYEIHEELLNSRALQETFEKYGSYLLAQAYGEGSPTHPSYPSGHATVAGACVTVLKACFDEDYPIELAYIPHDKGNTLLPYNDQVLTIGNELNKLANNIAIGRNAAGVHYRQDGVQGMALGEQVAIAMLRDESSNLFEYSHDGFYITKFNGEKIQILGGEVIPLMQQKEANNGES